MDESLEKALLDMEARDQAVRTELTAAGELDDNYHPRLEELHRANASRLRQIIAVFGWPGTRWSAKKARRPRGASRCIPSREPAFMRQCRDLIDRASQNGDAPRWQFAIIDDRIRVYEGRPQRYGTQLRMAPNGLEPHPARERIAHQFHAHAGGLAAARADSRPGARGQPQPPAGGSRAAREARGARVPPRGGLDNADAPSQARAASSLHARLAAPERAEHLAVHAARLRHVSAARRTPRGTPKLPYSQNGKPWFQAPFSVSLPSSSGNVPETSRFAIHCDATAMRHGLAADGRRIDLGQHDPDDRPEEMREPARYRHSAARPSARCSANGTATPAPAWTRP